MTERSREEVDALLQKRAIQQAIESLERFAMPTSYTLAAIDQLRWILEEIEN